MSENIPGAGSPLADGNFRRLLKRALLGAAYQPHVLQRDWGLLKLKRILLNPLSRVTPAELLFQFLPCRSILRSNFPNPFWRAIPLAEELVYVIWMLSSP